jgi:hypothetical protein
MRHTGHNYATTPRFAYQQIILLPPITIKYKWQKKILNQRQPWPRVVKQLTFKKI